MNAAWPLALACTIACTKTDTRAPPPRDEPKPVAAAAAVSLPELERARLEYLFEAAGLVARSWPELGADQTCLLLIAQTLQWVVNCAEAPDGFERTAEQFRGLPVFSHTGDSFETAGETRSTSELLARTPAAAHVFGSSGRKRPFPNRHPWLLLGTLEALRQFHPAFGPATTEHWLSVAMHEFVHIHQLRQPSFAPYAERIDARELQPAALVALYAGDADLRAQIVREHQQLSAAGMRARDGEAARLALSDWLRSYRKRSARIARRPDGAQLLHDERLFMYLEGVARFVESDFLVNPAQHPTRPLAGDPQFHGFEAFLGRGYAASPNRQLDDEYYYAIGYHLCVLLERVDPGWQRRVDIQPGWLLGVVEELLLHRVEHARQ
ncbi:MAG TPA: hypothetical protein VJV78_20220 [Polyangiales bacterium]|nr:hypothetical protein [Polyangiales bacterium]